VTSIERTAYPRFKRLITAHELHLFFAPSRDEVEWAAARTDCDEHFLAQLLALKSYQRMGCFPKLDEIPETVVDFVRRAVDLPEGTVPKAANRTAERQRTAVRQRTGLSYDKAKARKIAEAVMRSEAVSKNRPADLINIALEKVVEAGLELPGFTTLDALAAKVRTEVNASICMGIYDQLSEAHRERLLALLSEKDTSGTTKYNRLKQSAKAPTWTHFRAQAEHLGWVDELGETGVWLAGVASGKITDFAGEADAADAPGLRDYSLVKRLALLVCLVHKARMRGALVRKHFEAMVFAALAEELRTGDVAVAGSEEYADWSEQLLPWEDVETKLGDYLVEVGLAEPGEATAYDAVTFRRQLEDKLTAAAAAADAGYPDNEGLVIDPESGIPSLKAHRSEGQRASAKALEREIKTRMPERSLLGIISRTAYWVEWWRRFGPASGNEPKLKDPFGRYVITTFVKGTNMGPYEAARHIPGVSGHELSLAANRHFSIPTLNEAIADLVNAHARLDISQAWGNGPAVAADGTHMDTYLNNLLSETSVRYGKPGGIAYHHISDTYIALFTHFIPCGVWEAVYIIEGLLKNTSEVKPTTVHADTQGQSFPVFALAHLLGFDLMPRIRNWKDLTFYRPTKRTEYVHIDALFGEPGRNVIDFDLIESQFRHLMRVAVSVREGAISSTLLLRRLRAGSRKNATYTAFREVGRVIRTVQLLRYLSDAPLRRRVTAATNKVEAFNGFSQWIGFGNGGVIIDNDLVEQEKTAKFNALLTNAVIFHNALDIAEIVRQLQEEGYVIDPEDLAHISPYLTEHVRRFGEYSTHELGLVPEAYDPHLDVDFSPLRGGDAPPAPDGYGQAA
jgi:TnpA family transposase